MQEAFRKQNILLLSYIHHDYTQISKGVWCNTNQKNSVGGFWNKQRIALLYYIYPYKQKQKTKGVCNKKNSAGDFLEIKYFHYIIYYLLIYYFKLVIDNHYNLHYG
jgi:hypothetical protein